MAAFDTLFRHSSTRELDGTWIERYRARRAIQRFVLEAADVEQEPPRPPVEPNAVQIEALDALEGNSFDCSGGTLSMALSRGRRRR